MGERLIDTVQLVSDALGRLMERRSQIAGYVVSGDGHYIVAHMKDETHRAVCVVVIAAHAAAVLGRQLTIEQVRAGMASSDLRR